MRIFKTLGAVLLVCAAYGLLGGRNPCFACIGAVFGMGSFWREGVRHGGNRFLGTLLGGLVVIPFYCLYTNRPFGLPGHLYLVLGLFCVIYINLLFGAHSAIQPAAVVYFVVMFTVTKRQIRLLYHRAHPWYRRRGVGRPGHQPSVPRPPRRPGHGGCRGHAGGCVLPCPAR